MLWLVRWLLFAMMLRHPFSDAKKRKSAPTHTFITTQLLCETSNRKSNYIKKELFTRIIDVSLCGVCKSMHHLQCQQCAQPFTFEKKPCRRTTPTSVRSAITSPISSESRADFIPFTPNMLQMKALADIGTNSMLWIRRMLQTQPLPRLAEITVGSRFVSNGQEQVRHGILQCYPNGFNNNSNGLILLWRWLVIQRMFGSRIDVQGQRYVVMWLCLRIIYTTRDGASKVLGRPELIF